MTLDDLQRHYDTYYSPNNATLVVVGDIKADACSPRFQSFSNRFPRGPEPKPIAARNRNKKGERRFLLKREAQVPFVMMGYRVPNYTSEDSYALTYSIRFCPMGKVLALPKSRVRAKIGVGSRSRIQLACRPTPAFSTSTLSSARPESRSRRRRPSSKEIKRLQAEPPTEQELQRAKNQVEAVPCF